jgi:hypothetical protein
MLVVALFYLLQKPHNTCYGKPAPFFNVKKVEETSQSTVAAIVVVSPVDVDVEIASTEIFA